MEQLVQAFPQHVADALSIARSSTVHLDKNIHNIIISGLGGSGIGGALVRSLVGDQCPVPIITNNDYHLPSFANNKTLVIISSYSGNTEETVSVMKQALEAGCKIACVTSGGQVLDLAKKNNLPAVIIPGGNPPRSMLAFSLIQLLGIFEQNGWCNASTLDQVQGAGEMLDRDQGDIKRLAGHLATPLVGKLPVLYISGALEPIAIRWRQQINENSKMLCWHNIFPEMNHNELVGWEIASQHISVILLRTEEDFDRTAVRMDICKGIFGQKAPVNEVVARGNNRLERAFFLIHLGDWLSIELAKLNNVDPVVIDNIDYLKNELSKIQ